MTTSQLKTGVQPTPKTSCISDIPQTKESVQYIVPTTKTIITIYICIYIHNLHKFCSTLKEVMNLMLEVI